MDKSPFAKLSAELRNEIYSLVVNSYDGHWKTIDLDTGHPITPPIARVCSQMRKECIVMHFKSARVCYTVWSGDTSLGSDDFDRTSIADACKRLSEWLNIVDDSCHNVIRDLLIIVNSGPTTVDLHTGMPEVLEPWQNLAKEIKRHGYKIYQVEVNVVTYEEVTNDKGQAVWEVDEDSGPEDFMWHALESAGFDKVAQGIFWSCSHDDCLCLYKN